MEYQRLRKEYKKMLHDIFGEIKFNVGWKTQDHINLFGKEYNITLKLQAYFEKDGITNQQEKAYIEYSESSSWCKPWTKRSLQQQLS